MIASQAKWLPKKMISSHLLELSVAYEYGTRRYVFVGRSRSFGGNLEPKPGGTGTKLSATLALKFPEFTNGWRAPKWMGLGKGDLRLKIWAILGIYSLDFCGVPGGETTG